MFFNLSEKNKYGGAHGCRETRKTRLGHKPDEQTSVTDRRSRTGKQHPITGKFITPKMTETNTSNRRSNQGEPIAMEILIAHDIHQKTKNKNGEFIDESPKTVPKRH